MIKVKNANTIQISMDSHSANFCINKLSLWERFKCVFFLMLGRQVGITKMQTNIEVSYVAFKKAIENI